MSGKDVVPHCPTSTVVSILNSKWKILILYYLLQRPCRFNELKRLMPRISQKVLTDSLRSLESDGLIDRNTISEVPPRVEYAMSDLGRSMIPMIKAMHEWGTYYMEQMNLLPDPEHTAE